MVAICVDERQMQGERPGEDYMAWRRLASLGASDRVRGQVIRPLQKIVKEDIETAIVSVAGRPLQQTQSQGPAFRSLTNAIQNHP